MNLLIEITAKQLKKGDKEFAGQEVKNPDKPQVILKINSAATTVAEDMWLVEYHDGTQEIWNTEKIKEYTNFNEVSEVSPTETTEEEMTQEPDLAEDVRIDDETPTK